MRTRTVHGCVLTCAAALAVSAAGAPSGATATEPAHGSAGDRVVASSGSAVASRTVSAHSGSRRGGSGQVIWAGDAESPSSREWATGNAFDVNRGNATSMLSGGWSSSTRVRRVSSPVAQGSSAYAVTVLGGDRDAYTSGAQRTEVGQNNASRSFPDGVNRQMTHGQERWIALQLRIPADFPSARWNSLVQLKGAGTGNGPFGVSWENGRITLAKSERRSYGSTDLDTVWAPPGPSARDRWLKLAIHVKWSTGPNGFYELLGDLGDGQGFHQLKPRTDGWTLKRDAAGEPVDVGARFGIYRSAIAADATAYFDGFTVARTRADATRRAFGSKH